MKEDSLINVEIPIMLTIKETSELYHLSVSAVRRIAKSGAIRTVAIGETGKKLLISKDSFDRFLLGD